MVTAIDTLAPVALTMETGWILRCNNGDLILAITAGLSRLLCHPHGWYLFELNFLVPAVTSKHEPPIEPVYSLARLLPLWSRSCT